MKTHTKKLSNEFANLPLAGLVAAGEPLEVFEEVEYLEVPNWMIDQSGEYFALRVAGYSMTGLGIHDKDYVIVKRQDHARNNDVAVVWVNGKRTLKLIKKYSENIALLSFNSRVEPILVTETDDFKVMGILKGVCSLFNYVSRH